MNATDQLILLVFKKEPSREFSTSEIIKAVYAKEYHPVKDALHRQVDKEQKRDAGRKKGELHRRILYHLGKLCQENILQVKRVTDRGEKVFSLALGPGSYVIEKRERKIVIENPNLPVMEHFHAEGIIRPFEKETLLSRANAVLVDVKSPMIRESGRLFDEVNDVLGIFHSEAFFDEPDRARAAVEKIVVDARDTKKEVCFLFDLPYGKKEGLSEFISYVCSQGVPVFLRGDAKALSKHQPLLESCLDACGKVKGRLFIQKSSVPVVCGRGGLYLFDEAEWNGRDQSQGVLMMTGMSVEIDIDAFLKKFPVDEWGEVVKQAQNSLFLAGRLQRVSGVAPFVDHFWTGKDIRSLSRNYIRCVYEDEGRIAGLLLLLKHATEEYCVKQEYLYSVCGLSLRFRIAIGRGGASSVKHVPLLRKAKITSDPVIVGMMNDYLGRQAGISGYDVFRMKRSPGRAGEVGYEVLALLASYDVPVLCVDFAEVKGDVELTKFMGE